VTVKLVVEGGKVTKVEVTDSTVKDAQLEAALAKLVKRWRFPKHHGKLVVSYPFLFNAR